MKTNIEKFFDKLRYIESREKGEIKKDYYDIIIDDVTIMQGQQRNGIYILSQPVSVMYTSKKYHRLDNVSDIYLWHYRLGHINKNRINKFT